MNKTIIFNLQWEIKTVFVLGKENMQFWQDFKICLSRIKETSRKLKEKSLINTKELHLQDPQKMTCLTLIFL